VCRERLELLKKYNSDIPIYGLYGGKKEDVELAKDIVGPLLTHVYIDNQTNPE